MRAVQGDVGWSSFEAREAASKIAYRGRLLFLPRTQWAHRVFEYLSATCMRTDWTRRVYHIENKYGFFGEKIEADTATKWSIEVRRRVKEAETIIWSKEMESKSTLNSTGETTEGINAECFYDTALEAASCPRRGQGHCTLSYTAAASKTPVCAPSAGSAGGGRDARASHPSMRWPADCSGRGHRSPSGTRFFTCSRQRMETTSRMDATSAGPAL
ncbi:hypothetical protein HPB49_017728 [Dermacentor silvarum]|uniref:Uncharacterized protein n=1 Tax=Dermacentor silvarum TaxID=543639 RepID=A0ACB8DQL1_DERSI|nr:hypothetical protein HPB49_017728 [Dermacentor silvarum]